MEFHEMDIVGEHLLKRETTLPTYSSADKRNLCYVNSIDTIIIGTSTKFVPYYGLMTISVTGSSDVSADEGSDSFTFVGGNGITFSTSTNTVTISAPYSFGKVAVTGETTVSTTEAGDTINFYPGGGIFIFSIPGSDTINFYGFPNFGKVAVSGQTTLSASSYGSILTFTAGAGLTLSVASKTLTFTPNNDLFTNGRILWVYENTAPSGWQIVSAITDALLAVKGGSNDYNTSGGSTSGTWTQPGHTHSELAHGHSGPSHTHTYASHTHTVTGVGLTEAQMPPHKHRHADYFAEPSLPITSNAQISGKDQEIASNYTNSTGIATYAAGSGATHTHTLDSTTVVSVATTDSFGNSTSVATTSVAEVDTWRPYAHVGVLIERNVSAFPTNATRTVNINSSVTGGWVKVFPVDINGNSDGTTNFSRQWYTGSVITVFAPAVIGANTFSKWQKGGVDYSSDIMTSVTIDADYTLNAVYV